MKKNITVFGLLLIIALTLLMSCSNKDEIGTIQKEFLGTWVSTDKSDTLYFTTKNDFYQSNGSMIYDHYDYKLFPDSIEIRYSGKLYILVQPTMHKYSINNGILAIDFSNVQCYGFPLKEITYKKENNKLQHAP